MKFILQPWQLLLMILTGALSQQHLEELEYLRLQDGVWRQLNGKRRIRLNNDQRRLLAVKAKALGRKRLMELPTIFAPDTILRWHQRLVAAKWDYSDRRQKPTG